MDGYSVVFKVIASEMLIYDSENGDDKHKLSEVQTKYIFFHDRFNLMPEPDKETGYEPIAKRSIGIDQSLKLTYKPNFSCRQRPSS